MQEGTNLIPVFQQGLIRLVSSLLPLELERQWVISPGPCDAIKQLLLSNFVGYRLHAFVKLPQGDLPVAVRVHTAPRPPRLRQRKTVECLHGLLLLDFVEHSILVQVLCWV